MVLFAQLFYFYCMPDVHIMWIPPFYPDEQDGYYQILSPSQSFEPVGLPCERAIEFLLQQSIKFDRIHIRNCHNQPEVARLMTDFVTKKLEIANLAINAVTEERNAFEQYCSSVYRDIRDIRYDYDKRISNLTLDSGICDVKSNISKIDEAIRQIDRDVTDAVNMSSAKSPAR